MVIVNIDILNIYRENSFFHSDFPISLFGMIIVINFTRIRKYLYILV